MKKFFLIVVILSSWILYSNEHGLQEMYTNNWSCNVLAGGSSDVDYEMQLHFNDKMKTVEVIFFKSSGQKKYSYSYYISEDNDIWIYYEDKSNPAFIVYYRSKWLIKSPAAISYDFSPLIMISDVEKSIEFDEKLNEDCTLK